MTDKYTKVSETEIAVEKPVPATTQTVTYNYKQLVTQREFLVKHKAEEIAIYDTQIAEIDEILAKCKELGVKEQATVQPTEAIPSEPVIPPEGE